MLSDLIEERTVDSPSSCYLEGADACELQRRQRLRWHILDVVRHLLEDGG